jgi:peptidoglycan/LPS O-acetylase OafA/YrhL
LVLILEIARGVAALWVVLFHMEGLFQFFPEIFKVVIAQGHLGVPMFFVISGFVITYSAESALKTERSPYFFLKNRLRRIYPTFWFSVLVCLSLPYIMALVSMLKTGQFITPPNPIEVYDFSEWFNFLLLTKIFFADGANLHSQFKHINPVYWTIAIEIQFYFVVFIGLFFKQYYRLFVAAVALIAILMFVMPFDINHGLFIHFWLSFCVGIFLAYLFKYKLILQHLITYNRLIASLFGLIYFLILLCILVFKLPVNDLGFALLFGAFLWFIAPLEKNLVELKFKDNLLIKIPLQTSLVLGAMSYSVYLLHFNLYRLSEMFVRQVIAEQHILFGIACVIVTLVMCYPFYYVIERKFMSKHYNQLQKNTLKSNAVT